MVGALLVESHIVPNPCNGPGADALSNRIRDEGEEQAAERRAEDCQRQEDMRMCPRSERADEEHHRFNRHTNACAFQPHPDGGDEVDQQRRHRAEYLYEMIDQVCHRASLFRRESGWFWASDAQCCFCRRLYYHPVQESTSGCTNPLHFSL